jgi:hypothetical protein
MASHAKVLNVFRKEGFVNTKQECYNQTSLVSLIILNYAARSTNDAALPHAAFLFL